MANPFINPVGSVDYSDVVSRRKNRHGGTFSENNPYLDDLEQARSKQDQDAIYNMAMQWEADFANLQIETEIDYQKTLEQREYDYKMLQEQRAYEDPSARIARERAAGLNPDIAGTGNSAGTGGATIGAGRPMPSTDLEGVDPVIPTKNRYQSVELIQRGFDVASGFISSLSSFVGTAVGGFASLSKMPSEIALNDAQATATAKQADTASRLADSKIANDQLLRISQNTELISRLSQDITPETSDTDALDILSALGFSDDDAKRHLKSIRTLSKAPALVAYHKGANVQAKEATALDEFLTPEFIGDMVEYSKQTERHAQRADYFRAKVSDRIAYILSNDPKYAQNVAGATLESAEVGKLNIEFEHEKLKRDVAVWAGQMEQIKTNLYTIAEEMKEVDKIKDPIRRTAMRKQLNMRRTQMYLLGANEFSAMYDIMNDVFMKSYYSNELMGDQVVTAENKLFTEMTFGYFMQSGMTGRDLAESVTKNILNIGLGVGAIWGASKGASAPTTSTSSTTEERYDNKKGYQPYRRTTTTTTK